MAHTSSSRSPDGQQRTYSGEFDQFADSGDDIYWCCPVIGCNKRLPRVEMRWKNSAIQHLNSHFSCHKWTTNDANILMDMSFAREMPLHAENHQRLPDNERYRCHLCSWSIFTSVSNWMDMFVNHMASNHVMNDIVTQEIEGYEDHWKCPDCDFSIEQDAHSEWQSSAAHHLLLHNREIKGENIRKRRRNSEMPNESLNASKRIRHQAIISSNVVSYEQSDTGADILSDTQHVWHCDRCDYAITKEEKFDWGSKVSRHLMSNHGLDEGSAHESVGLSSAVMRLFQPPPPISARTTTPVFSPIGLPDTDTLILSDNPDSQPVDDDSSGDPQPVDDDSTADSQAIDDDNTWHCDRCEHTVSKHRNWWKGKAAKHLMSGLPNHGVDEGDARESVGLKRVKMRHVSTADPQPVDDDSSGDPQSVDDDSTWHCDRCDYTVTKNWSNWKFVAAKHLMCGKPNHGVDERDACESVGLRKHKRGHVSTADPQPVDDGNTWHCDRCEHTVTKKSSHWKRTAALHLMSGLPNHGVDEGDARESVGLKRVKRGHGSPQSVDDDNTWPCDRCEYTVTKKSSHWKRTAALHLMSGLPNHGVDEGDARESVGLKRVKRGHGSTADPQPVDDDNTWHCDRCEYTVSKHRNGWKAHAVQHLMTALPNHGVDEGDARESVGLKRVMVERGHDSTV